MLRSAETEVAAAGGGGEAPRGRTRASRSTIELRQALTGVLPRFGGFIVRRAAAATLDEALDGLERISG